MAENEEKKGDDQEEEFIMVGDGVEEGDQKVAPVDEDKHEDKHEDDDDLEAGADDKRAGHGEPDDDDKKERRRSENKSRRQRQKEARERDQRELKFLRSRNETVEKQVMELTRRQNQTEVSQVDARINQLDAAIKNAGSVYAKAISAGEGDDAAEAMSIRDTLKEQRDGLKAYKEQAGAASQQDEVDPVLVENVRSWHGRNKWFDFGRRDEDSAIAGAIDDMMARDGWDPRSPEYYDELDKRVARRLPHLGKKSGKEGADDLDDDRGGDRGSQRKQGGPKFRVGGRERSLKSNEVHISKERRDAMQEAGMWDDPVLRKKQLARYASWDKEHANENA